MNPSEISMSSAASGIHSQVQTSSIYQLKRARSYAKGTVTRIQNELKQLMLDSENIDRITKRVIDLKNAFKKFQEKYNDYHSSLVSKNDLQESLEYFTNEDRKVAQILQTIEQWTDSEKLKLEQSLLLPDLQPEDSVSNVSSIISKSTRLSKSSVISRASKSSSFSSAAKVRVSAKKAALSAEKAKLKQ